MSVPSLKNLGAEPFVAKRKARESWRQAVARRAALLDLEAVCLATYDTLIAQGKSDYEAAYRALGAHGALEPVDAPRDPNRLAEEADRTDAPGIGS